MPCKEDKMNHTSKRDTRYNKVSTSTTHKEMCKKFCKICESCIISYIDGPAHSQNVCSIEHLFIEYPFYRTLVRRTQVHRTQVLVSLLVGISRPEKVSTLKPAYRRPGPATKNKHNHAQHHTPHFEI